MEREIKFSPVSPEKAASIFDSEGCFIGEPFEINMQALYFDTPQRALKKAGVSLRVRQENHRSVVCVKKRIDSITRIEEEAEASSVDEGISLLLRRDGLPAEAKTALMQGGFLPLFGSRFLRRGRLMKAGDSVVEVVYDKGLLFMENRFCGISEIELELKEGKEEDLAAAGQYFALKYGLKISSSTKAGRAAALTQEAFKSLEPVDLSAFSQEEISALFDSGKLWYETTENGKIYYKV